MTNYEHIKSMSIDKLSEWLDEYGELDNSPWIQWFNELYCNKCEPIMCHHIGSEYEFPCSWCELNDGCKYFPNLSVAPNNKMIIKMWLESEAEK